nr:transglycosylase SLT domain-containing protein [Chania multitudinisentens]
MGTRSLLMSVLPVTHLTVLSVLAMWGLPPAQGSVAAGVRIPEGYRTVASQHQVPAEVLFAVALAESGRTVNKVTLPWPWTLNVAGKSYRYATRAEGCQALTRFMRTHPLKRIDVGLGQTNLGYNGHHYRSACEAFEPYDNLNTTARILRACYRQRNGSWLDAAACYHRPAGGAPAKTYRAIVQRHLSRLMASPTSSSPDPASLAWVTPKES